MSELQSSAVLARYRVQNVIMLVDTFSSDLQDTTFFNRYYKLPISFIQKFLLNLFLLLIYCFVTEPLNYIYFNKKVVMFDLFCIQLSGLEIKEKPSFVFYYCCITLLTY